MTKVTNYRLEVAKEERQKRDEMVDRQKTEAITVRQQKVRGGISFSSKEKGSYGSDIRDKTDPDQVDNEYPLPF